MKKLGIMLILLFAIPSYAEAQSHLESSYPAEGGFEEVQMTFSAGSEETAAEEVEEQEAAESAEEETVSPFDNVSAEQDAAGFSPFVVIIPILIAALIGGFFVIRRNRL